MGYGSFCIAFFRFVCISHIERHGIWLLLHSLLLIACVPRTERHGIWLLLHSLPLIACVSHIKKKQTLGYGSFCIEMQRWDTEFFLPSVYSALMLLMNARSWAKSEEEEVMARGLVVPLLPDLHV
jgi:hypothetical protein